MCTSATEAGAERKCALSSSQDLRNPFAIYVQPPPPPDNASLYSEEKFEEHATLIP